MPKEHLIYKDAVNKWGVEAQICMCMEECAELIQALNKYLRSYEYEDLEESIERISEEIADVEIMIEQVKLITSCDKIVEVLKSEKLRKIYEKLYNHEC